MFYKIIDYRYLSKIYILFPREYRASISYPRIEPIKSNEYTHMFCGGFKCQSRYRFRSRPALLSGELVRLYQS